MAAALKTRVGIFCFSGALAVFGCPAASFAQASPAQTQKPCNLPQACPAPSSGVPGASPAKQFPYPGESKPVQQPPTADTPDAPSNPPSSSAPASPTAGPSQRFPYPGGSSTSAPDSGGSSSSSSSSDPSAMPDSPADPTDAANADKFPRRRLPKVRNLQSDEDREAEDLSVARFYRDKGNLSAAYLRSKDAVKHGPDDPDAHLLLAEVAQKLNMRDEAIAEYNAIFKLDASDHQVKEAHKALDRLK